MKDSARAAAGLPAAEAVDLASMVNYAEGAVVSRTLAEGPGGTLTLFAFDAGQALSEHTAPFDALVYLLDGAAEITIAGKPIAAKTGDMVIMPGGKPHALKAVTPFKMLLVMIRN